MTKSAFIFQRFLDVFRMIPTRIKRLIKHFLFGRYVRKLASQIQRPIHLFLVWVLELWVLFFELLGLGEIFEILITLFKRSAKPLSPRQLQVAIGFFGDEAIFRKVRLDENAKIGTTKYATAYVTAYTINTGGPIENDILIHELVHVIQYQKYGLRYITRALYGQNWGKGYNHGGLKGFLDWKNDRGETYFFNPEQEAEFIADLYLLSQKKEAGYFGRDLIGLQEQVLPREVLGWYG